MKSIGRERNITQQQKNQQLNKNTILSQAEQYKKKA